MPADRKVLHLTARGFSDVEHTSLRTTLAMARPWLQADWRLIHGGRADVVLVMGQAGQEQQPGALVVSCLTTQEKDGRLCLRWPLRATQLMALLNDCQRLREDDAARSAAADRYLLRVWPMRFVDWPAEWWRVLAALSRRAHSVEELVMCTALPIEQVNQCLAALGGDVALAGACEAGAKEDATAQLSTGWRRLAERITRALGVG